MQGGGGNMGSHKHAVSGYPGKNARYKALSQQEAKAEERIKRKRQEVVRSSAKYDSVHDVFAPAR